MSTQKYEAMQQELDALLARLEDPMLDVDEAAESYERGLKLIQKMQTHLATVESRIEKVHVPAED